MTMLFGRLHKEWVRKLLSIVVWAGCRSIGLPIEHFWGFILAYYYYFTTHLASTLATTKYGHFQKDGNSGLLCTTVGTTSFTLLDYWWCFLVQCFSYPFNSQLTFFIYFKCLKWYNLSLSHSKSCNNIWRWILESSVYNAWWNFGHVITRWGGHPFIHRTDVVADPYSIVTRVCLLYGIFLIYFYLSGTYLLYRDV